MDVKTDMKSESETEEENQPRRNIQRGAVENCGALGRRESEKGKGSVKTEGEQFHMPTEREGEVETTSHEHEWDYLPSRRMVWWRKACWIRIDDGPN